MLHLALALPLLAAPTPQDWPQFKGPDANSTLPALGTDFAWGDGQDAVLSEATRQRLIELGYVDDG